MSKQKVVKRAAYPRPLINLEGKESGLKCPLCDCMTLNRDSAPAADGWFIEWCSGGVIRYREVLKDGEVIDHEFPCPYAWAGFKK